MAGRRRSPSPSACDTDPAALWDSLTNRERNPRWFLPISGDLEVRGHETVLDLRHETHVDLELWARFGPGGVGIGWDLGLVGLVLQLDPEASVDRVGRREA